jgi:hypothetical protein
VARGSNVEPFDVPEPEMESRAMRIIEQTGRQLKAFDADMGCFDPVRWCRLFVRLR